MALHQLQATVERVVFFNPESGYAVVRLRAPGERDLVTAVGNLSEVHPGEVLLLEGDWKQDPRHGRQFQATSARTRRPADLNGLLLYLGSGLVPGLGPVLARRLVEHFGEEILALLDADPGRVQEAPGIGPARARSLAGAWARQREVLRVMEWLRDRGVSTLHAARIFEAYRGEALQVLVANPYRIALEVPGFGFVAADRLGKAVGVRPDSPVRVQAGVEWCLHRAADDGDCYLPYAELAARASSATGADQPLVAAATRQLAAAARLFGVPLPDSSSRTQNSEPRTQNPAAPGRRLAVYSAPEPEIPAEAPIYLAAFERAEAGLAVQFRALLHEDQQADPGRVARWIERYQAASGLDLAPEQREALLLALRSGLFVLTGGPGTGKTTTLRALHRLLAATGRTVALAAPTGKAARRISEVTGAPALTVHRLLGAGRSDREFTHHETNPLPHDVVVVDECSMLDLFLAYSLARAVRPGGHLVLVGDAGQLPSVGPGQVLGDLLASGAVPAVRLERVFRQAAASRIVTAAHQVGRGEMPDLPAPGEPGDLWLVEAPRGRVGATVISWTVEGLPRRLGVDPGDVQVLSPQLKGEAGVEVLNERLQALLNPPGRGRQERFRGALPLREGDRVIHTANNYRLEVFNGETGSVARIDPVEQTVTVDFGDRQVEYTPSDVVELEHAYALTVHRAQGSEWPAVVVALSTEHDRMLGRNLLYTALTRGRRAVLLVGERAALAAAIANDRALSRRTGLARRLQEEGT